jgi:putative flippase GtrA
MNVVRRFREVMVYGAGATAAFAVDAALLMALVEIFGMHYLVAATVSFVAGTMVVYLFSIRYAFAYRRLGQAQLEFVAFAALGVFGVTVNLMVMYAGVQALHLHYLLAKVLAAGITFFTNYGSRRLLLFTPDRRAVSARSGASK